MIKFYKVIDTSEYYSDYILFQSTSKQECIKYYEDKVEFGLLNFYYEWWEAQHGYNVYDNSFYILEDCNSDEYLDMAKEDFATCLNFAIAKGLWYDLGLYDVTEWQLGVGYLYDTAEERKDVTKRNELDYQRENLDLVGCVIKVIEGLDFNEFDELCEQYHELNKNHLVDVSWGYYVRSKWRKNV